MSTTNFSFKKPAKQLWRPEHRYMVRAGAIWANQGCVFRPGWLRIERSRVAAVGAGEEPPDRAWAEVDWRRYYLIPGLIDAHVHLDLNPGNEADLCSKAALAADFGLTAVRDGGDKLQNTLAARHDLAEDLHVSASGSALYSPGRYGSFIGRKVSGRQAITEAVRSLSGSGAAQIKVLASGPVGLDTFGHVGGPQFSAEELSWLIGAAQEEGLPVMAHANGPDAVAGCVRAGVHSIEHGYFMGEECLRRLAETQTAWIPTIVPLAALADREPDSQRRAMIDRIIRNQQEQLLQAHHLGVPLMMGTDAGSPGNVAGPSIYREMRLWHRAGLPVDAVLEAAVTRPVQTLGLPADITGVKPGAKAVLVGFDLDLFQADPFNTPPALVAGPEKPCL